MLCVVDERVQRQCFSHLKGDCITHCSFLGKVLERNGSGWYKKGRLFGMGQSDAIVEAEREALKQKEGRDEIAKVKSLDEQYVDVEIAAACDSGDEPEKQAGIEVEVNGKVHDKILQVPH
jgi:hypothetical protein